MELKISRISIACFRTGKHISCTGVRTRALEPTVCVTHKISCAAFALGGTSSNDCPANYLRLDTPDVCGIVAKIANRTYGGAVTSPGLPAGCYWVTLGSTFYYNLDSTGAANVYAQPLCSGAAFSPVTRTSSPARTPIHTRARTHERYREHRHTQKHMHTQANAHTHMLCPHTPFNSCAARGCSCQRAAVLRY
jgi:hypothetical protein